MPIQVHEHCKKMATKDGQQAPWYEAFPEPVAKPKTVEPSEVFTLLEEQKSTEKPKEFLLVDVRRNDYEGGTVATSINLPAQSLYPTRKVVFDLAKQAGVKKVIFYCGQSLGRGPRAAGWMQDYINETGDTSLEAAVMTGGIRGWVNTYGDKQTEGYDAKVWEKQQTAGDQAK